jgi:hypothetical protein
MRTHAEQIDAALGVQNGMSLEEALQQQFDESQAQSQMTCDLSLITWGAGTNSI